MVYFGFFIRQTISFSYFTQYTIIIIEDEIYSVGLGQKMAPWLIKEINFNCFIIFLAFLWKTCKDLEKLNLWLKDVF